MSQKTLVMKFGGASVATPEQFSQIADRIVKRISKYLRVAIVVSAMGDTTDKLIALAQQVNPSPPRREYDMLVTAGERISISLLAMALAAKGCEAISFTGSQSGIITCGHHSEAKIIDVRPYRILSAFQEKKVVIIAGFQGVSLQREITTLGRGGSDTTAVALGVALNAEKVEFYKDVPGIFSEDPKENPDTPLLQHLNYAEALKIICAGTTKVLHPRCVLLAQKNRIPLHVRSFQQEPEDEGGTIVAADGDRRVEQCRYEEEGLFSAAC